VGCSIVNPGSLEKLSWAEMNDEKGFVWADLNGSETTTKFIKLDTRPMETADLMFSKTDSDIAGHVLSFLEKLADAQTLLKLNLQGSISREQYGQLRINEVLNACRDMFFQLNVDRKALEVEGYGRIFLERVDSPVDAFSRRLDLLIAQSPNDKQLLEQVKKEGIKYLEIVT
jgi:DNA repair exonuclease SbcCD nuclease subunit